MRLRACSARLSCNSIATRKRSWIPPARRKLFAALGLDYELPDTGCCGMAGPFGFERSITTFRSRSASACLLPKVRAADKHTLIVANGFSCREQIAQTTNRQALHPAQVLKMALEDRDHAKNDAFPELRYMPDIGAESKRAGLHGVIAFGLLVAVAMSGLLIWARRR